jgi:hypothetical protein
MAAYSSQFRALDGWPRESLKSPARMIGRWSFCVHHRSTSSSRYAAGSPWGAAVAAAAPWTTCQLPRMKSHWPADWPET